ncbi:MAG: hypothetical protein P4L46_24085 [Fimbriimonas sp.]|nr:hypothetical protein [Fimbriimonas sp.]
MPPRDLNSIFVIGPYRHLGIWVFDDEKRGLIQEPFVGGADSMIDRLTEKIPNAQGGFRLVFSALPFPNYDVRLTWRREEMSGNVYYAPDLNMEGWLCPALLRYFGDPPVEIYAKFEAVE